MYLSTSTKYKYQVQVPSTSTKYKYQVQVPSTSTKYKYQVQVPSTSTVLDPNPALDTVRMISRYSKNDSWVHGCS